MSVRSKKAVGVSIREWLGGAPSPWPGLQTLQDGDAVIACYYLSGLELLHTKQDKPYLRLQLSDRNGTVEGRVWDDAPQVMHRITVGCFVGVRGRVQAFRGEHQLKVEEIEAIQVDDAEMALFLPQSSRSFAAMEDELQGLIGSITDPAFSELLAVVLERDTETGRLFRLAPAAKRNHHACVGGLLEHTISVARICSFLAAHYHDRIDGDLLLTGALLHDIGKIREIDAVTGFPYTDEGKLLGHILIGFQLVADAAREVPALQPERLRLLLHLIASHQGRYEWQSPREPHIVEAMLLHYADDLDAKADHAFRLLASVEAPGEWSPYDRSLGRSLLNHAGHVGGAPQSSHVSTSDPATDACPPMADERSSAEKAVPEPEHVNSGPDSPASRDESLDLFEGDGGREA